MTLPPSIFDLNFDPFQRMAMIVSICERLVAEGCETAVDVGGHPGTLADLLPEALRCLAVIDLPPCERADAVRGSALQIPLQDRSVDVVLSADTLEHVGDPAAATREMTRVARRAVVITAPWQSEATDRVETALCEWHERLTGQPHPWLSEHRENGLPRFAEVDEVLHDAEFATAQFACGTLAEWALLQTAMLLRDALPESGVDFEAFNRAHNAAWPTAITTSLPAEPYRTVLVAARDEALLAKLESLQTVPAQSASIAIALPLLEQILTAATSGGEEGGGTFDAAYRERLEALTRQQAEEIQRLRDALHQRGGEGGILAKITSRAFGRGGGTK